MTVAKKYDVALLGAGFGASLLAAILSKQGLKVCMIDRESHPRFSIGESSTPAADMILPRLCETYGLDELMPFCRFGSWRSSHPEIGCGCKRGFSYFWHGAGGEYQATENHQNEMLVAASSSRSVADTQWFRADVDHFVCDYAVRCGTDYFSQTNVVSISHQADFDWEVALSAQEKLSSIQTDFLVDATGPAAILLNHLQIEDETCRLKTNTSAVYSHFKEVPKAAEWLQNYRTNQTDFPYPVDDSAIHQVFNDGWLWQLRFENGVCSIGYVSNHDSDAPSKTDVSWDDLLKEKPVLKEILGSASVSHIPGKIYKTKRLQRLREQAAGRDWAALPFTAGFIDPLHSTGIAHTLLGVERLAAMFTRFNIISIEDELSSYSERTLNELRHIDHMVSLCYDNLHRFPRFRAACMIYFAAATTFEKTYLQGADGFLCAGDLAFQTILNEASMVMSASSNLSRSTERGPDPAVDAMRGLIEPYNHVGLFHPQKPNMYFHTAATKE
ncbi:tryptophan 7-halogenase [bacterium]|jgi:tetracycline 7-halogenase / FADH2 O2-dependent halogenase|nr:tryptophan 7-halogenase [bacterium]